jgi:hypothetical protein
MNKTFYTPFKDWLQRDTSKYYYIECPNLYSNPIYVRIPKKAFTLSVRLLIFAYGVELISGFIDQLIYAHLKSANSMGAYYIDVAEDFTIVEAVDVGSIHRASELIVSPRITSTHKDIYEAIQYIYPEVRFQIDTTMPPQDNSVVAHIIVENKEYPVDGTNTVEVSSLSPLIKITQARALSKVQIEYVLLRVLIKLLLEGAKDATWVLPIDSTLGATPLELEAIERYYRNPNLGLLWELFSKQGVLLRQAPETVLELMSQRIEIPVFILKGFLNV